MPEPIKIRRALISVYDKTGIVDFARALHDEFGVEIISTGGTAKALVEAGIPITLVEDITGFPEMLGGRVKTLHPKIHAAILADRDNPEHMRQLKEQGIKPIDMVVVNLYPFEKTVADPDCKFEDAIEMIDIGGPSLLRAAAKNHKYVLVVPSSVWNGPVLSALRGEYSCSCSELSRNTALHAYRKTREYDGAIAAYLQTAGVGREASAEREVFPERLALFVLRDSVLRYGENPHQRAALYLGSRQEARGSAGGLPDGGWLSFNNRADASAALELCAELTWAGSADRGEGSAKMIFALPGGRPREAPGHGPMAVPPQRGRRFPAIADELTTRRKLPHWQIAGATYFVTFSSAVGELGEAERDAAFEAVCYWDGKKMDLHAAVVMGDHVHLLLTPRRLAPEQDARYNLSELLQSIKANSARSINRLRGTSGQVWVRESYDRWMRDCDEFAEKWNYIAENPVKEGLALSPEHYPWWHAKDVLGLGIGVPVDEQTPRPTVLEERPAAEHAAQEQGEAQLCPAPHSVCVFIKHTNACGVGIAGDPIEAYRRAYLGDPKAAMGGILAVNFNVDAAFAEAVMDSLQRWGKEGGAGAFFVEVWLAPSFDEDAVEVIRTKKKWGERVRLLDVAEMTTPADPNELEFKSIAGGVLAQTRDLVALDEEQWKVVTERQPSDQEMADLRLAWLIAKHTRSNAISICKDGMLIGNGAGQMSRVMSCRIATWLAKENGHEEKLHGAAAASDGFFPFRDGPDLLADAGVSAIIQPGGSKRDQAVIDAGNERGSAVIFTGTRHFKH